MLSLAKIRGFIAVAELGSFKLASDAIGRTQPALTTQIADLEKTLGVKLFARTTRKTILTREGKRFLVSARRALDELDNAVHELRDTAALNRGRVSLGCVPTLAAHVLPPVVAEFTRAYPAIEVVICDEVSLVLQEKVSNGELDFALCPEPGRHQSLTFDVIFTDWFVVAYADGHRFSGRSAVPLAEILAEDNLTLVKGTNLRETLDREIARQGLRFVPRYELYNHYSLGGMVEGGMGVTMLPYHAFPMLRSPRLANAPIIEPRIGREVGIVKSNWRPVTPAAQTFLDVMRPLLTETVDETAGPPVSA